VSGDRDLAGDLEDAFDDLTISVQFVENESEALQAICSESQEGYPAAAWISAFTYAAAREQCEAIPVLATTRGRSPRTSVGETIEMVTRTALTNVSQLRGQPFCRIDAQDRMSWIYPSLVLHSQGVNPATDLGPVRNYDDEVAMLRALYEGDCAAAALAPGELDDLLNDLVDQLDADNQSISLDALQDRIKVLIPAGNISVPDAGDGWPGYEANVFPFSVLVFPPESAVPAALRAQITETLEDFFTDRRDGADRLDGLLDATGVIPVGPEQFEVFMTTLTQANWDMAFVD
jgi:hypothetical protein